MTHPLNHLLTGVKCRATSVAKNMKKVKKVKKVKKMMKTMKMTTNIK